MAEEVKTATTKINEEAQTATETAETKMFQAPCPISVLLKAIDPSIALENANYRWTRVGTLRFDSRRGTGFINDHDACLIIAKLAVRRE